MGGEIDIMEAVSPAGDEVHGTLHYSEDDNWTPCGKGNAALGNSSQTLPGQPKFNETFTTFGVEWDQESMVYYWNETSYFTFPRPQETFVASPFYYILNLAVGGGWPGDPDKSTVFPQEHLIDWVRHYTRKAD